MELTGDRYGRLLVMEESQQDGCYRRYLCLCDCGNEVVVRVNSLRRGITRSCGCLQKELAASNAIDLISQKFGKLVVIERNGSEGGKALWSCQCDCGNFINVISEHLQSGNKKSCGCLRKESGNTVQQYGKDNLTIDGVFTPILKSKLSSKNSTGIKGVYRTRHKESIRYRAVISVKKKRYHLGVYDTLGEAAAARKAGEEKYHQPYLDK